MKWQEKRLLHFYAIKKTVYSINTEDTYAA